MQRLAACRRDLETRFLGRKTRIFAAKTPRKTTKNRVSGALVVLSDSLLGLPGILPQRAQRMQSFYNFSAIFALSAVKKRAQL
jgi:hypothetical protein